jgi:acetylglutamate kinase|tara:strand:- start:504 stop:1370 length:867 start_codon:yes stop_codon:yes gene_type:complete
MSINISFEEIKKFWPSSAPNIKNINKYVNKYKSESIVIKCGGNVLIDKNLFDNFIDDIIILNKLGLSIIVVHGGGPRIKKELEKSNITTKFIRGLRVTDNKIINIVENVLIDFNNEIVNAINKKGAKAISINTKAKNIINVTPENEELGFVGAPEKINEKIIDELLKKNQIPIVAPLGIGKNYQTYNINGDTAAGAIAKSLKSRRLLLMTNVEGVLDKKKNLVSEISSSNILEMIKNGTITGGMIPKINTCLDSVKNGVTGVAIIDGRKQHSILNEIFSDTGAGTLIR